MNLKKHVSLNINVRGVEPSATLAINERCKLLESQGERVKNLGLGQSPFPVPTPVVNALRLYASEKDYLPVKGLAALQEAVAEFHRKKDGVSASPENVIVGPGSKELMFLLQIAYYGEIIVPTPAWVSYVPQAQILGKRVRLLHTTFDEKWHINSERLARFLESEHDVYRPRILILNYPGNPDGVTYTPSELEEIARVAREYEVILLSDEIYGQLHHRGEHVSVARFYPEGTIISSGLSKWCGAGGWRLGTFTFPPDLDWLLEAMATVASETYTSVSAPIQFAAVHAFRGGIAMERYLWHARRILSALGSEFQGIVSDAGIRVHPPEGGFYLFLDFSTFADDLAGRGIRDGATLCERLLADKGVATLPGSAFGRPDSELSARIAYVNFDGSAALAASETIPLHQKLPEDFIPTICDETIEAAREIASWLREG
ncbi:pyridoxal phosphate-dependent aminotransferase [Candidatus Methanocrinis natronophilus]|uniref:Aminotransferase n=1 Tax=Candidatus Methanocrinis natronophilus TaxID=3033396 RepID=A0ABT5XAA3_9EURY|nr:aminotransferase class I/II-fold pyridoxal phosphate-dependent enzyme [Candidatus Methanocrinis natronophilus]MDF0591650.1 aminotransferase class I/II-fold pyridoxal phosphate-dependent enzyme [Candidatus Methanocrinis natronophilus]